ncbi:MAG: helix-turn-helix transcriptional regulator, partial [Fretibacterium sp.]|nr:helix-turn-helix transcriptional regulator [Fretibacterium sp.]
KKGITQKEAARIVGITQSHYNRIERGEREGSFRSIQAICQALDIPISEISMSGGDED